MPNPVVIIERNRVATSLGSALQIKVFAADYRLLSWREVWEAFAAKYPGRWAAQVFPPAGELVDGKNVYHLFVFDAGCVPDGLNIKG
jgi:hypothetical protein